jgi:parallel beta-helix repeat protein
MNNKKTLVCTLVMLLTLTSTLGLFVTVKADVWTDITLPYVITEAGNYRIMDAWSGSGIALTINASDVVVDGQNFLIELTQTDEDCAVFIVPGSRNVLLDNINETSSDYGVFAEEVTFTAKNCMFTNNTAGVFALNASDFTLQDSRLSNNSYGLAALYAGNFSVLGCHVKNNSVGIEIIDSANFTLSHLYLNNNTQSFLAQECLNFNVTDCTINDSRYGLAVISSGQINVRNCEFNNDAMGFYIGLSNFTFTDSSINQGVIGVEAMFCEDFSASNVSITGCEQGFVSFGNNFTLQDFSFNQNRAYNALVLSCNATMKQGLLANGLVGLIAEGDNQLTLEDCIISNNTWFGAFLDFETNTTINSNLFSNNGFDEENSAPFPASALAILDSNCTASNNLFENNNETLLWSTSTDDVSTTNVFNNNLQNNTYTFFIGNELSESATQQFNFYNNLVNDTAYLNPQSIDITGPSALSAEVFHLNTTLQVGHRIINDGGRMIGGNYWAYPNGTGPSQIGVDANTDGFLDEPFDFLGNATIYDYLPYSSSFVEFIDHLVISPQAATMTVGSSVTYTTTAYDQYGNSWEVDAQYSLNDILVNGDTIFGFLPVGGYLVGASYHDIATATILTVMPGSIVHFMVYVPATAAPGEPFNIRITALDVAGNIAAFSGTVTISVNSSSITPATSGTFSWGTWLGSVTIPEEGTFTIRVDDGNGHTGTSNSITIAEIIEPTPTPIPTPTATPTATPDISEGPTQLPETIWYVIIIVIIAIVLAVVLFLTKYRHK